MNPRNFFAELKRRNVYRAAVAYAAVAWLLVQIATQTLPFFDTPAWVIRFIIIALPAGFPFAMIVAWLFEWTPRGIVRTDELPPGEAPSRNAGRKLDFVIISVLAVAIALLIFDRFRHPRLREEGISDKSIAVLPFENLSDDKQNAYFADGVQDEILTDLAKIADLKVISRTSVMQYKSGAARNLREIAQQLGVAHVLEGSVQRAGGKVRVNAQLIEARNDKHLWAKTYDREVADVFAIETELAQSIANELQAKLSPGEKVSLGEQPTNDLVAHDFYVRATSLLDATAFSSNSEKDFYRVVDLLTQALARDPAFVAAYCSLARVHDALYLTGIDHTPGRLTMADSAIKAAFRLRPDAGEAHLALAWHRYWGYFDYEGARSEIAVAARTLPNNPRVFELLGLVDRRQGRWADAVKNMKRVCELDPKSVGSVINLAVTYWLLRDYEHQAAAIDRLLAIDPRNLVGRIERPYIEIYRRADTQPLHAALQKILADDPAAAEDDEVKSTRFWLALYERDFAAAERALADLPQKNPFGDDNQLSRAFFAGVVARAKGDAGEAQAAFSRARLDQEEALRAQPDDAATLCGLGAVDAGLGRKEEARREGQRAIEVQKGAKWDPLQGPNVLAHFALICAWTGERDLAVEQLETLAHMPGGLSYGELRLNLIWDSLRGDSRFEKIVADLAPKDAKP